MAATALVAGYVLLLSLRQLPSPSTKPVAMRTPDELPDPSRLPHRPSFVPASAPVFHKPIAGVAACAIVVTGLPETGIAGAGIAVFEQATQSPLEWLPLAGLPRRNGNVELRTDAPRGKALTLTLAASETSARFGYLCRVAVPADRGDEPIVLDAAVQTIAVNLGAKEAPHNPVLSLRRMGDEQWRPLAMGTHLAADEQGILRLTLGRGTYELVALTESPWLPLTITVPGAEAVAPKTKSAPGGRP